MFGLFVPFPPLPSTNHQTCPFPSGTDKVMQTGHFPPSVATGVCLFPSGIGKLNGHESNVAMV